VWLDGPLHQDLGGQVHGVIAEHAREGVGEDIFPIRAGPVEKEKFLLSGERGERVPGKALQKRDELVIRAAMVA
jgi:hypothetical protein